MNKDKVAGPPVHVSIIMDGNGRWAEQQGRERVFGHLNGVESVRSITEASVKAGVRYLSLYAFSEENWSRPEAEVGYLMKLMGKAISDEMENFMRNGVRFVVLGNRGRISPELNMAIDAAMEMTRDNANLTLILFLSYSGRWDILQAAKRLAGLGPEAAASADQDLFSSLLVTSGYPDPDLIIRTSGEQRLSNYLLWQGSYSELYFTDVLWPDFREDEYLKALRAYSARDRRYGKVK